MVKPDEIYRHYKDPTHLYKIIALAKDTENLEDMVVYQALYESHNAPMFQIWVRPLKMFESLVDGKPRFQKIDDLDSIDQISDETWNEIKKQNVDQEAIQKGVEFLNKHLK